MFFHDVIMNFQGHVRLARCAMGQKTTTGVHPAAGMYSTMPRASGSCVDRRSSDVKAASTMRIATQGPGPVGHKTVPAAATRTEAGATP